MTNGILGHIALMRGPEILKIKKLPLKTSMINEYSLRAHCLPPVLDNRTHRSAVPL